MQRYRDGFRVERIEGTQHQQAEGTDLRRWVVHKSEREKGGGGKTVGGEEEAARDIPYCCCLCC